jgi:succinate--hydroxymethylglutarate CoA-transferase
MASDLLDGVRVLAVEQYGAGPFATQYLADLGAEIIKIEDPASGGDSARTVGPHFGDNLPPTAQSYFFQGLNRNKKSLTLDITKPEGRAIFHRLIEKADAVASNLRGDVPEKLGITYPQLAKVNPRIVCGHLTGYGRSGPRAAWPGYDYLMQAETGYFHLTGDPEGPPSRAGLSLIDLMTGVALDLALVSGLLSARETGKGRDVDVSLFDLSLANLNYIGHWYLNTGAVTTRLRRSAHPSLTPCQTYRTRDGWIYLMCNKERFWPALCGKINRPEWADDPRFRKFPDRLKHRDLLTDLLDQELSARTTAEWMVDFAGAVPAAPILDVAEALDQPFVSASDRIDRIPLPSGEDLRLLSNPIRTSGPVTPNRRAPALGENTEDVLADIGIGPAEFARLRTAGVV